MHDPDVFASFAVGNKRDPFSIGRKLGLAVESHPAIDQFCSSTFDRQGVNIAEQFEYDTLSVRRNIQREPRSLVCGEFYFSRRLQRQSFLLVLFLVLLFVFFILIILSHRIQRPRLNSPAGSAENHRQRRKPHRQTASCDLLRVHALSSVLRPVDSLEPRIRRRPNRRPGPASVAGGQARYAVSLRRSFSCSAQADPLPRFSSLAPR